MSVMYVCIPCMFCVALSMDLFCVLRVCEWFGETVRNMFWCVCYLVVERDGVWLEVLFWIDHVWSSKESVCCACGSSERLNAPSICSGKCLQLLCILPFGMLCLSAISMMFVKILLAVCMLVGMVV